MEKKSILKLVAIGIVCLLLGVGIGNIGKVSSKKYKNLNDRYVEKIESNASISSEYKKIEKELSDLKEATKNYTELNETEKNIVDTKIQEVKQATKEEAEAEQKRIAEEKAQKEAEEKAKREAEEQAKREEEERKKAEEQAKKEAEEQARREAEAHKYETGLTYEQIAREGKKGTLGQFEGKIVQVMNGNGFTQYRVTINGDYNEVMLIEVMDGVAKETLLEDDYVYFKGESLGTITYTTVMGAEKTIPAFECHEITR